MPKNSLDAAQSQDQARNPRDRSSSRRRDRDRNRDRSPNRERSPRRERRDRDRDGDRRDRDRERERDRDRSPNRERSPRRQHRDRSSSQKRRRHSTPPPEEKSPSPSPPQLPDTRPPLKSPDTLRDRSETPQWAKQYRTDLTREAMENLNAGLKEHFDTSFADFKSSVGDTITGLNNKLDSHITDTTQELEKIKIKDAEQDAKIDNLQHNEELRQQFAGRTPDEEDAELAKILLTEEALMAHSNQNLFVSNLFQSDGKTPMAAVERKVLFDKVLTPLGLKPNIEHVTRDGTLMPFSKLLFTNKDSAAKVSQKWAELAKQGSMLNGAGKPVFTRCEQPQSLRKLRKPLIDAERLIKDYHRSIDQKPKIHWNWKKHSLILNTVPICKRNSFYQLVWLDMDLKAKIDEFEGHKLMSAPMEVEAVAGAAPSVPH